MKNAPEGSNENDVCVASMHHFFRCYSMTHTASQHARMIGVVMTALDKE